MFNVTLTLMKLLLKSIQTPWIPILPEKLIVAQVVKTYPQLLDPNCSLKCLQESVMSYFLSQISPVHIPTYYIQKLYFNVIIPRIPTSSKCSPSLRISNKNLVLFNYVYIVSNKILEACLK